MPDREKVIKGLEEVDAYFHRMTEVCYRGDEATFCDLKEKVADAIAMLKEQEGVVPEVEVLNEIDRLYRCPKCHKCFFYEKQKYCDQCGQAVKWDE